MSDAIKTKIDAFFSQFPIKMVKKGTTILRPEEPLTYIYNIAEGFVKSYSLNDNGIELTINIYKPYSFFPITETLAGRINTYFFEAITDVTLQKAPTPLVHAFVQSDSEVSFDLIRRVSSGLEGFMVRTQYLIRSNATQKVASSLVLLARRFGETALDQKITIQLPQTQTDIANLSGVSRETASLELMKLQRQGIIKPKQKRYVIHDFERLKAVSSIYYEDQPLPFTF